MPLLIFTPNTRARTWSTMLSLLLCFAVCSQISASVAQDAATSAPVLLDPPRGLTQQTKATNMSSAQPGVPQAGKTDRTAPRTQPILLKPAAGQSGLPVPVEPFTSPEPEEPSSTDTPQLPQKTNTPSRPAPTNTTGKSPADKPADTLIKTPAAVGTTGEMEGDKPAELFIKVAVPHGIQAVDGFAAYPYPVKPPKIAYAIGPLPVKRKDLKGMLMYAGYNSRSHSEEPYPPGGWRFQYAMAAAQRRSGISYPHTMIGVYPWINDIIPYIRPEIERSNKAEEERKKRYEAAVAEYDKKYFEIQNESTRNGLFVVNFRLYRKGQGYARLPAGTWWIAGQRKVPGLSYYWQIPITIASGARETVTLREDNALVIQGGW